MVVVSTYISYLNAYRFFSSLTMNAWLAIARLCPFATLRAHSRRRCRARARMWLCYLSQRPGTRGLLAHKQLNSGSIPSKFPVDAAPRFPAQSATYQRCLAVVFRRPARASPCALMHFPASSSEGPGHTPGASLFPRGFMSLVSAMGSRPPR